MDVSAIVHDHGPDVSKMGKQCGIHDFLCFDHELDLTVNAGISCDSFGPIFRKSSRHYIYIAFFQQLFPQIS